MVYGLLTVLNIKDMGFFIPHRYAAGLKRNKNQIHWIHKWFSEDKVKAFSDTLELVSAFNKDLKKIDYQSRSKNKPRWHQDWFPGLDAAVAYVCQLRLRRRLRHVRLIANHWLINGDRLRPGAFPAEICF